MSSVTPLGEHHHRRRRRRAHHQLVSFAHVTGKDCNFARIIKILQGVLFHCLKHHYLEGCADFITVILARRVYDITAIVSDSVFFERGAPE